MTSPKRLLSFFVLVLLPIIVSQCSDDTSDDYYTQALEYTNRQEYEKAQQLFLKAIVENPKHADAYYGLGGIYNYKKMYEKAVEAFQKTIQLDPTHFNAHYSLGYTYELMDRKEESEKAYQKYRELKKKFDAFMKTEQEKR